MAIQPPEVVDAVRDLCTVIADNPTFRDGAFKAGAERLALRIDTARRHGAGVELDAAEIGFVLELSETVARAIVNGTPLIGSGVLMRVCERVIGPLDRPVAWRPFGSAQGGRP